MNTPNPHRPHDPLQDALKALPDRIAPPTDLWPGIEARLDTPRMFRLVGTRWLWYSGVAALLVIGLGLGVWMMTQPAGPTWAVETLSGMPRVASGHIAGETHLGVGEWLETDAGARAELEVADIGTVIIEPNSRVQLVETGTDEHRIALEQGRIQASIFAPPRLFLVDTPSATAVDMGCAYTLDVTPDGAGMLHVSSGWVALEHDDRSVLVPAGARSRMYAEAGPGTPYFDDASPAFKAALDRYDVAPTIPDLNILVAEARGFDTLTLWHLLYTTDRPQRDQLYEAITNFYPTPEGVTRDSALNLDAEAMETWKMELEFEWIRGFVSG